MLEEIEQVTMSETANLQSVLGQIRIAHQVTSIRVSAVCASPPMKMISPERTEWNVCADDGCTMTVPTIVLLMTRERSDYALYV